MIMMVKVLWSITSEMIVMVKILWAITKKNDNYGDVNSSDNDGEDISSTNKRGDNHGEDSNSNDNSEMIMMLKTLIAIIIVRW